MFFNIDDNFLFVLLIASALMMDNYFIIACLFILWHKIDSMRNDITELRNSITEMRRTSKTENKKVVKAISDLGSSINKIHEALQTEESNKLAISTLSNGINEGLNLVSTTNSIRIRQYPDYSNKETLWKDVKSHIDQKKSEGRSNNSMFNEIASKTGICSKTVYNFYHRKTKPRETTVNKIRDWFNKEVGRNSNLNDAPILITLRGI
ncbi:hypothetical protein F8M41_019257 [Gigaspora margarita]|uniref:Uncharacterized protein n=1 Tax=Gigaspora margarita TaxID=4874 RepID=A0A8H4EKS1_GIGMA|nr:hypothetical protein F8M41_019257 [Gigaspora margarita]